MLLPRVNSTRKIQFNDASQFIHGSSATVLSLGATSEIDLTATAIDINGTCDVSGAFTTTTITASGIVKTDDTTEATSTTDGSLQTDGGLSVAKDAVFGDDVKLLSDAAVLGFGADGDVTLTHVADTGVLLNSTMAIQFNDASQYINAPSNAILDINATDEIELNATLVDVNANLDVSGTITSGGVVTGTAFTAGSAVLAEAELELLDGLTAGTAIASKVVTTDASIDTTGQRNLTISGELDAATLDISGAIDVAGNSVLASVDVTGVATAATFEPDGDTAAGDNAAIGYTAGEGLILTGQGSTNDVTIKNDADVDVITIATGTTNVDIVGDITGSTLNADGDTAASDNAAIGYTSAEGLILTGQGSTNDITIKNDADAEVFGVPTGTTTAAFTGTVTALRGYGSTETDTSNTGSITLDFSADQNFVLTLTGNVTLANPSTEAVGQSGFIAFIQDGTGSRTITLGTDYETAAAAGLTLTSTASATDLVPYLVVAANRILLGAPQLAFS